MHVTQMHTELFSFAGGRPLFTPIDYSDEMPAKMSKEIYVHIYRRVWATIRHDIYKDLLARKKDNGGKELTEDEFAEIYET